MSAASYDAIVIGAGANGLAAAATLAKNGKRVLVAERAESVGGLSRLVEIAPGFRAPLDLDAGWASPSLLRGLGLTAPASTQPATSVSVAHDGSFLALPRNERAAADVIRKLSPRDADRWTAFTERTRKLSEFLGTLYQLPPPDVATTSLGDLASLIGVGRKFRALGKSDMTELLRVLPMSVQDMLDDELESATLKAAIGAGGVRDIRQGPRSGGTTFVLLHYLIGASAGSVRARDWWTQGPDAFVVALESLARQRGVAIRTSAEVARISVKDDAVAGVVLANGEEIAAPMVLSTADPKRTLLGLVDPVWLDPEVMLAVRNIKLRGCTTIVQYALDTLPNAPGLSANNLASVVSLSPSLDHIERAYDDAKYGRVSSAPHVELSVPSLRWPSLAPSGKHVLVARAQYTPYTAANAACCDPITAAIANALPGFADRILQTKVLTPRDLEAEFGVTDGAMTHGELTLDQILFMRPIAGWGRYAMPVDGLYLAGAGASPGPGLPGAAGLLAARSALD